MAPTISTTLDDELMQTTTLKFHREGVNKRLTYVMQGFRLDIHFVKRTVPRLFFHRHLID